MSNEELVYQDAHQLANWIQNKKISCKELTLAFLEQINRYNPHINAIINLLDEEAALKQAEKADRQIAKDQKAGLLHGLPIALKEMVQTRGWPNTYCWAAGTQNPELAFMGFQQIQQEDGLLAARMRKAGLLFIGQTNMPEFAFGSHTRNKLYGITRNPYQLDKSAGGSSGGAAAALASGILPLADGSDLGGSLRNPAAFCNIIGFRPSMGRVPKPDAGWAGRMATEGPMARCVKDIALLLAAQAGPHPKDPLSIQENGDQFLENLQSDVSGLRLGWTPDFGYLPVEKTVVEVAKKTLGIFEDMGLIISRDYPDIMKKDPLNAMDVFRTLRVVNLAEKAMVFRKALGKPGIRKYTSAITQYQFIDAFDQVDAGAIYQANANRIRIYNLFLDFFQHHDFLICPSMQVLPFDVEADYVRQINNQPMTDYLEWMSICCILSIAGLPIISMPCGFSPEGLPVGIQIVGKPGADLAVLKLAYAFEQASRYSAKFKENRPKTDY